MSVPDDFDTMDAEEIVALFEGDDSATCDPPQRRNPA